MGVPGTEAACQAERKIKEQRGEENFFDESRVSIESLKTHEVTAGRIERKITQIRAGRK